MVVVLWLIEVGLNLKIKCLCGMRWMCVLKVICIGFRSVIVICWKMIWLLIFGLCGMLM